MTEQVGLHLDGTCSFPAVVFCINRSHMCCGYLAHSVTSSSFCFLESTKKRVLILCRGKRIQWIYFCLVWVGVYTVCGFYFVHVTRIDWRRHANYNCSQLHFDEIRDTYIYKSGPQQHYLLTDSHDHVITICMLITVFFFLLLSPPCWWTSVAQPTYSRWEWLRIIVITVRQSQHHETPYN